MGQLCHHLKQYNLNFIGRMCQAFQVDTNFGWQVNYVTTSSIKTEFHRSNGYHQEAVDL